MRNRVQKIGMMIGIFSILMYIGGRAQAQPDEPFGGAHVLVQHTLDDLQRLQSTGNQDDKDRARTDVAVQHLSSFDSRLMQHHFDKDTLDKVIKEVSAVAEKNHLGDQARNAVVADAQGLRQLRAKYDSWH